MKRKSIITLISSVTILIIIMIITISYNKGNTLGTNWTVDTTTVAEENIWEPYKAISDTSEVYKVTWQEKYGTEKTEYCAAAFKHRKTQDYKLIAPWLDEYIIKAANLNSIKFEKKEMKRKKK